jgi:hypothetical protein
MYTWSALIAGGTVTLGLSHGRPLLVVSIVLAAAAMLVIASNVPRLRAAHRTPSA